MPLYQRENVLIKAESNLIYSHLTTERFILKVLTPDMVGEEYCSWLSNPETSNFIIYTRQDNVVLDLELNLKKYVQEKYENENVLFLGIFLKDSLLHIGNIKFEPIDFDKQYAVLGVLIGNEAWRGVGVFAEISKVLEKYLSENKIKKIYLGVDRSNLAAVKAYFKEGYIVDEENILGSDLDKCICMVKNLS